MLYRPWARASIAPRDRALRASARGRVPGGAAGPLGPARARRAPPGVGRRLLPPAARRIVPAPGPPGPPGARSGLRRGRPPRRARSGPRRRGRLLDGGVARRPAAPPRTDLRRRARRALPGTRRAPRRRGPVGPRRRPLDVQAVLERVRTVCTPGTRVVVNTYNRLWELPLRVARAAGLAQPLLPRAGCGGGCENLLRLTGFEPIRQGRRHAVARRDSFRRRPGQPGPREDVAFPRA